ncbi:hypothetical protein NA57DRAFT_76287 [Rhizodiscina lignyota]|uniref:Uncharacterized protein n=1 Tax=Rhizodiscina lignyota TaxID=1504668 RepID=A0A9P4IBX9_9PEZI|nr:hypothetical protein NA57DRAFT_76287 [Rhizodiscina lignyota]
MYVDCTKRWDQRYIGALQLSSEFALFMAGIDLASSFEATERPEYEVVEEWKSGKDSRRRLCYIPTLRTSIPRHLNAGSSWILIDVFFILLTLWGSYSIISRIRGWTSVGKTQFAATWDSNYHIKYATPPCDCGDSVAEASSRGCKYDELSTAWYPQRCRDDELTEEFHNAGDGADGTWQYFADRNFTEPLSVHQVSLYGDDPERGFFMSREWHVVHCLFNWRKEHRLKARGKFYDPVFDGEGHVRHCITVITLPSKATQSTVRLHG